MKPVLEELEVWFVTGSQDLYGSDALRQVEANAARVAAAWTTRPRPGPGRVQARGRLARRDRRRPAATPMRPRLRRRHRVDAHLLAGARCGSAASRHSRSRCSTCTRSSTAICPWGEIDMDFMNLHQAAHGDREFALHPDPASRRAQDGRGHWEDAVRRGPASGRGLVRRAAWREAHRLRWPGSATTCARSPTPRVTRSRPRSGSGSTVNGYGVERARGRASATRLGGGRSTGSSRPTPTSTTSRPSSGPAGSGDAELRDAARIEAGLRAFLTAGGFGAFTDTFEDLGGLEPAAGHRAPSG